MEAHYFIRLVNMIYDDYSVEVLKGTTIKSFSKTFMRQCDIV